MNQELPAINGELLRLRRETRGWALTDMATRACMSVKQIRQIEEGGSSAFYNESVKRTSAKKVGNLLGLEPDEVFVQVVSEAAASLPVEVPQEAPVAQTFQEHLVPEPVTAFEATVPSREAASAVPEDATVISDSSSQVPQTPQTPWWSLAALFIAALAVAAWMRPEPEVVTEPAPVLQTLPAEASDATPASAPAVDASASVAASAPKAASTPAAVASAVQVPVLAAPASAAASASVPRVAAPAASVASAATAAKPANAVQTPAAAPSAASAASKPL